MPKKKPKKFDCDLDHAWVLEVAVHAVKEFQGRLHSTKKYPGLGDNTIRYVLLRRTLFQRVRCNHCVFLQVIEVDWILCLKMALVFSQHFEVVRIPVPRFEPQSIFV